MSSPAPTWRWRVILASRAERTAERLTLDQLELNVVLGACPGLDAEALLVAGLEDLHSLRREVNKRLALHAQHAPTEAGNDSQGRGAEAVGKLDAVQPLEGLLPQEEEVLCRLADRILALANLQELLLVRWSNEAEHEEACLCLLSHGISSVEQFAALELASLPVGDASRSDAFKELQVEAVSRCIVGDDKSAELNRRLVLSCMGSARVLVTAPHNVFLRRDGKEPHTLEEMTSFLALELARELQGSALCWSREAQWRTELCYALGQRRKALEMAATVSEALDPENRDPNHLHMDELGGSTWFRNVQAWTAEKSQVQGACILHMDVHGCQDPPKHPAHCMLGLGAMRQHAEALPVGSAEQQAAVQRLIAFAYALRAVGATLGPILGVEPSLAATITGVIQPVDRRGKHVPSLSGAWPRERKRLTQTQQSVSHAGATHAVQVEMSRTLRHALVRQPGAAAQFAHAMLQAWEVSQADAR